MLAQLAESAIDEVASLRLAPSEKLSDLLATHPLEIKADSRTAIFGNPRKRGFNLLNHLATLGQAVRSILLRRFELKPVLFVFPGHAQLFLAPCFHTTHRVDGRC